MKLSLSVLSCGLAAIFAVADSAAAPVKLADGDRIAMLGDSITAQRSYTVMLETYLSLCTGLKNLSFMQFGWPGDTTAGALARIDNDVLAFKPAVTTVMLGINDGRYRPYDERIALPYRTNLVDIVRRLKSAGSGALLLSPSTMDASKKGYEAFVDALARMSVHVREVAEAEGVSFADVNRVHGDLQRKMVAKLGAKAVFSGDGVHGYPVSHFIILNGILEGFSLDGEIGVLELDFADGTAKASDGHRTISASHGQAEFESRRYPYCFRRPAKNFGEDQAAVLPFCEFQNRYNRFLLKVRGLAAEKAKVVWKGSAGDSRERVFGRTELEKGVNLADAFDTTPFDAVFFAYCDRVKARQDFDVDMTCTVLPFAATTAKTVRRDLAPEFRPLFGRLFARQAKLMSDLASSRVPVRHVILVEEVK